MMRTKNNKRLFKAAIGIALHLSAVFTIVTIVNIRDSHDDLRKSLVFGVELEINHLDPILAHQPYIERVIGQLVDGLVRLDQDNNLVPAIAESWEHNEDYTLWTFKIRPSVQFHESSIFGNLNTRKVTAYDVAYVYERVVRKESFPSFILSEILEGVGDYQEGQSDTVKGINVLSEDLIAFKLTRPEPLFPYHITSPYFGIYAPESAKKGPDIFGQTEMIGTGPFSLKARTDTLVVMERNPIYWKKTTGNVEELRFAVIKNDQLRLNALRNGQIDAMHVPTQILPGVANLENEKLIIDEDWQKLGFSLSNFSTFNSYLLGFNCDHLEKETRLAISSAIDRKELIEGVANGAAHVQIGVIPLSIPGFKSDLLETHEALDGTPTNQIENSKITDSNITIIVHDTQSSDQAGVLLQKQLKQDGINVELVKTDYESAIQKMIDGNYDAVVMPFSFVFATPGPILENLYHSRKIPVPNFWRYRNNEVDNLLVNFREAYSPGAANDLAREIEVLLANDPPAISLFQSNFPVIHKETIKKIRLNGHSTPILTEVTLD